VARLDPSRTAVEVDELELTVANLLLYSPDDPLLNTPEAHRGIAELERAGIAEDGAISGYPAQLLGTILKPELVLALERNVTDETQRDFGAVADGFGIWAETKPSGAVEYTPIEPGLLPWQVARTVGLGPRTHSRQTEPLEFRAKSLDAALGKLWKGDARGAAKQLGKDPGLSEAERDVLMELLMLRRLSWRVASSWDDDDGEPLGTIIGVIDGGDAGLWFSLHLGDGSTENTVIRLTPTEPSEVWEKLVEAVPFPVPAEMPA
jgi:hypothetical protein